MALESVWDIYEEQDYFSFPDEFLKLYTLVLETSIIKGILKWIWHWTLTETSQK